MSIRSLGRAITLHVTSSKDAGELLERFRSAWAIIIDNIGVMPVLELQNLDHAWKHADSPFLLGREHRLACYLGEETAQFKYLNPRPLKLDVVLLVNVSGG